MKIEWDFSELYKFADNLGDELLFKQAITESLIRIAVELRKLMVAKTPVGTHRLVDGWDDESALVVETTPQGYEVSIVNKSEYAAAVNNGHVAKNQYGGPYRVQDEVTVGPFGKPKGRVKIKSPHQDFQGVNNYLVYGHFFVERSIVEMTSNNEIEQLIMKYLKKWWGRCLYG